MILFTGIVGLLMLGGLMMGPIDPDVDLTALEDADTAAEDAAEEELSASQNIAKAAKMTCMADLATTTSTAAMTQTN